MKKYSHYKVRRRGKLDGRDYKWKFWPFEKEQKDPYPPIDQDGCPMFEDELYEAGQQDLAKLTADWKELDKKLKSDYCSYVHQEMESRKTLTKETRDMEAAAVEMNSAIKKLNEFPATMISHKTATIWLFILAILEFPLNSVAFQILGASLVETYLISAGICVALPLLGHWIGRILKKSDKLLTEKILVTLLSLFAFGLIIAIAIFRELLFEQVQSTAIIKIKISPATAAFLFIIINLAVLILSAMLSYASAHHNQAEYNRVKKIYNMALKVYKRESEDAEDAAKEHFEAKQQLIHQKHQRQKTHDKFLQQAIQIIENFEWLVRSYRTANMYVRKKGNTPLCFLKDPRKLLLPAELHPDNLDWECEIEN